MAPAAKHLMLFSAFKTLDEARGVEGVSARSESLLIIILTNKTP